MSKPRHLAVFAQDQESRDFLSPYVNAASAAGMVQCCVDFDRSAEKVMQLLDQDVTIWLDGLDAEVIRLTHRSFLHRARVVCRVRTSDLLENDHHDCRWEFFDDVVTSSRISDAMLFERFDRIESVTRVHSLSPAVVLPTVNVDRKQRTGQVAFLGPIRGDNNAALLLQISAKLKQRDSQKRLVISGDFESQSLQVYFEAMIQALDLARQFDFRLPPDDLDDWLKDKDAIICTGGLRPCESTVLQAMALGVQPVVHLYFGAEHIFDPTAIFATIDQAADLLCETQFQPQVWRSAVQARYDVANHLEQFSQIIAGENRSGQPKVSILLPTYNRAGLLQDALKRLARQTYPNLEIVVVDDCSPDSTPEVITKAAAKQPNIVTVRNESNQGNAGSMAIAAQHATGEFVLVLSDDDTLTPNAVERYVEYWRQKPVDLIYCDLAVIDTDGNDRGKWIYKNYYSNIELLRELLSADGNRIPETFFCRRELYDKIYRQTYSRRFLNTYYLPHLRSLKMLHLPEPLYRYAIHAGSTFTTARGLFDRSKSTQNYINATMFMYSPITVMNVPDGDPLAARVGRAFLSTANLLVQHGRRRFKGMMYTGAEFKESDNLWYPYFYNAFHWLEQSRRYFGDCGAFRELQAEILAHIDPKNFDPAQHAGLPDIYRRLPWFANRCFNNVSDFVVLDIATIGKSSSFAAEEIELAREGKMRLSVRNHRCNKVEELAQVLSENFVTVINICEPELLEPTLRYLIENHYFAVNVLNFTKIHLPELETLKNIYNLQPKPASHFADYLKTLTAITTLRSYADTAVTTAV